ncbi:unnamed protein product [Diplocarpon coronariae]|uniref:Myb-like domain-containing protein n=1 Tax=Diplocarpon coronariae TaxID=2795749 RepID=A0A218Z953_9HELO|nr:hypothetical protein B2J93_4435 [Marssonina coronariae]
MLKGRSKKFAPKKVTRNPSGTASTRPNVSQPPEPSHLSQQNAPSASQQDPACEQIDASDAPVTSTPSIQSGLAVAVAQIEDTTVRPQLKRKESGDVVALPPAKRIPIPIEERPVSAGRNGSIIETPTEERDFTIELLPELASTIPSSAKLTAHQRIVPPKLQDAAESPQSPARRPSPEPRTRDKPNAELEAAIAHTQELQQEQIADSFVARTSLPTTVAAPTQAIRIEPQNPSVNTPTLEISETSVVEPIRPDTSTIKRPPGTTVQRYPSPENIARLVEENQDGPPNMGRAGARATGIELVGHYATLSRPGEVNEASEIVPIGALNPDVTSGDIAADETASAAEIGTEKPKRKYMKRKKVQPQEDGDDTRTTLDIQLNRPRCVAGVKKARKNKKNGTPAAKGRKQRAETPEGASEEEIDQSTLTMTDLCKDLRIGKKFSMHNVIKQRVIDKRLENTKLKMKRNNPELADQIDALARPSETETAEPAPSAVADQVAENGDPPVVLGSGPQMRIVNGNLVVDESSLQIDRQARARLVQADMEEITENDFTTVITSGTYMKRERALLWDQAATSRFYEGLAQFGTDFEMIAKLFPHRSRRQIKLKFNKEERVNAEKINRTMVGPKKHIDLKNFEKLSDMQLEELADIEAGNRKYDQEQLEAVKKLEEAEAEITRQKKAAIRGTAGAGAEPEAISQAKRLLATISDDEDAPSTGRESAKENGGSFSHGSTAKKRAPKNGAKKNKHAAYAGGEEAIVLGTIER